MANNNKMRVTLRSVSTATALSALFILAACASKDSPADAAASAPPAAGTSTAAAPAASTFNSGAPAPRFIVPPAADQNPPSVNTVPTEAPAPRSTAAEREEARKGLVADLANARHSEQGGRLLPVVVRPYVASAAAAEPPPAPDASRLDAPPPPRPPEASSPASNPAKPAAGPAPANRVPTGN